MNNIKWVKQARPEKSADEPSVTITRSGFILNHTMVDLMPARIKHAEIYISEDGMWIGFEFRIRATASSFEMGPVNPRSKTRTIAARELVRDTPHLIGLLKEGRAASVIKLAAQSGKYVGALEPVFSYDAVKHPPSDTDIGVYRLVLGADVVMIGHGPIKAILAACIAENLPFDHFQYFEAEDESAAVMHEARVLEKYIAEHGDLPLYNRKIARRHHD